MPRNAIMLTSARVLQSHLEIEFLLNEVFVDITLTLDPQEAITSKSVVYMEYDFDLNIVELIISSRRKLVLMHLGDEKGEKDLKAYPLADVILRNYYHKSIFENYLWANKVVWMPNGYKNGLGGKYHKAIRSLTERRTLACFIGWLSNETSYGEERPKFSAAAQATTSLMQCIPTAGFAGGLSSALYASLMQNAIYAPCPAGNAPETIRIFDAFELGCIPISLPHTFLTHNNLMGGAPVLILNSWGELPGWLEKVESMKNQNLEQMIEQQERVISYWRAIKRKTNLLAFLSVA